MKKVKVMLTAAIVLGTVGGVLAIKGRAVNSYCTASNSTSCTGATKKCTGGQLGRIAAGGTEKCYVVTTNTANCATANLNCTAEATIRTDD